MTDYYDDSPEYVDFRAAILNNVLRLAYISSTLPRMYSLATSILNSSNEEVSLSFCTQLFSPEFLEDEKTEVPEGNHGPQRLAVLKKNLWPNGSVLRVRFIGGTQFLHDKVKHYASQWSNYANISFDFGVTGDADILVSFVPTGGHWSYVGQGSKFKSAQNEPTMNLGLTDHSSEIQFSRAVTHEFGHAIGCVHEHQSPTSDIPWDKPKVYEHYRRTQGWSQAQVDSNLFNPYSKSEAFASAFDTKSIMLYPVPRELTTNGFSVGWNTELSPYDIAFIATIYPK